MTVFGKEIYFRKRWRNYQERVLSDLSTHLADGHLHIVAAPGSGKTVLGLEVVRVLDKPAVIFSPTLTIRDQWAERFRVLFCPEGYNTEAIISRDIRRPKTLTLSTYQGLYSALTGRPEQSEDEDGEEENESESTAETWVEKKKLIHQLKKLGVGTIVVDEAHHLRNEWWRCLLELKKQLGGPTVVALTATPPFDVQPWEWQRYQEMCGPIDAEITVPELVEQKDLCPHQDYVYFSSPTSIEKKTLQDFRAHVKRLFEQICSDARFVEALLTHPYVRLPERHLEEILENPEFFSSVVIFLWRTRGQVCRNLMRVLGVSKKRIPLLDYAWMEVLLTGCMFTYEKTFQQPCLPRQIMDELKRCGAIDKRNVQLQTTWGLQKMLTGSISKLDSIRRIVGIESDALKEKLRLVILTDYIRRAELPKTADDIQPIRRMGVVPIFETLRRSMPALKIGVLSGGLVIIPVDAVERLLQWTPGKRVDIKPLVGDHRFAVVGGRGQTPVEMVSAVTRLFNEGAIKVLIGTKSLLGEGWDAPAINALVLASVVGSYMLSNQMRGRAIRVQEGNPEKTANIWHLVCTEEDFSLVSDDFSMLCRRFKAYVGISFQEASIQNGIERLGIDPPLFSMRKLDAVNDRMIAFAIDRAGMRQRWLDAFDSVETAQMAQQVRSQARCLPKRLIITKTLRALLYEGLLTAGTLFSQFQLELAKSGRAFLILLSAALGVSALAALPYCAKALYLFVRHGPVELCMQRIGRAVLEALVFTGDIQTEPKKMAVKTEQREGGIVSCTLAGATTYEQTLFLDSLQEFLEPIENPRYVLERRSRGRHDYHAVPFMLGKRKEDAEYFLSRWKKYLGAAELVYTRSAQGRNALIRARGLSMSRKLQPRSERVSIWK